MTDKDELHAFPVLSGDGMFDLLLAGLPAELLSAMRKNKLTNPATLRSYPRSALGISTGVLPDPESTSSTPTDPGTLLLPTFAPDPNTCVVEPEDPDGLLKDKEVLDDMMG